MIPPTGRQLTLTAPGAEVTVVEVGAGLRSYVAGGRELVDGHREDEPAENYRGVFLAPWPNRIRDGRYKWDGADHQVAHTEPEKRTALHGFVTHAAWSPVETSSDRVVLEHVLHAQPGYPFVLRLRLTYALGVDGLSVTSEATNEGAEPLPYGAGHHPYFSAGPGALVDACHLTSPATTVLSADERGIPTGASPVAGTPYDFRRGRPIGDLVIDHAFTDLERDADGLARVRLTGADGRGVTVWLDESHRWLQVFTGDVVPGPRRRRGLAVEPMTCPPNAFQTGVGVTRLVPGETARASWGIVPLG